MSSNFIEKYLDKSGRENKGTVLFVPRHSVFLSLLLVPRRHSPHLTFLRDPLPIYLPTHLPTYFLPTPTRSHDSRTEYCLFVVASKILSCRSNTRWKLTLLISAYQRLRRLGRSPLSPLSRRCFSSVADHMPRDCYFIYLIQMLS